MKELQNVKNESLQYLCDDVVKLAKELTATDDMAVAVLNSILLMERSKALAQAKLMATDRREK